jgi:hypothetical protein
MVEVDATGPYRVGEVGDRDGLGAGQPERSAPIACTDAGVGSPSSAATIRSKIAQAAAAEICWLTICTSIARK